MLWKMWCYILQSVGCTNHKFPLQLILYVAYDGKYMVCTAHRLQCITLHFPKHVFPIICMRNMEYSNTSEINSSNSLMMMLHIFQVKLAVIQLIFFYFL